MTTVLYRSVIKYIILLLLLVNQTLQSQSQLLTFGPGVRSLGSNREFMQTSYYQVGSFGWLSAVMNEKHNGYYYPTANDYNQPGYFNIDPHNAARADFNGDGMEDLLITWAIIPHTIEKQTRAGFMILLNDGNGGLRYSPEIFEGSGAPIRFFAYRTSVEDFNRDGRPDFVAASMGMIKRNSDGTNTTLYEPIPLVLSTSNGKLRDASANIQGQENGNLPEGFTFGHELSAGDVNGDGAPDFFTGKCLFLNDGTGKFTNASNQLPQAMKPPQTYLMHSMIGDLNGDGIGDLVAAYADGVPGDKSGYILLSNGNGSFNNRQLVELPPGRYGAGVTKFNHGVIYDVNKDGLPDIVFSVTRANPYYKGRTLQTIINKGNGVFVDETNLRVITSSYLDEAQGEGSLHIVDVNADGITDLVHSGGSPFSDTEAPSITIYLNNNGVLRSQDPSILAWVQPWQLNGFGENFRPFQTRQMGRAFPINLDKKMGIDFVAMVATPLTSWPQIEPNEYTFYSIISTSPITSIRSDKEFQSEELSLFQNYPNPFNSSTKIQFSVNKSGNTILRVFNLLGQEVSKLFDGDALAGKIYPINFEANDLPSGVYYLRLESAGTISVRKMVFLK